MTVRFCDRYISRKGRTHDQTLQAARSGVQNIAEGSQAGGTSRKMELKLTNVARASLEELRLDDEDYLRHRGLPLWSEDDPRRKALVARRCTMADAVADWVRTETSSVAAPPSATLRGCSTGQQVRSHGIADRSFPKSSSSIQYSSPHQHLTHKTDEAVGRRRLHGTNIRSLFVQIKK